jgi:hypothetical protein
MQARLREASASKLLLKRRKRIRQQTGGLTHPAQIEVSQCIRSREAERPSVPASTRRIGALCHTEQRNLSTTISTGMWTDRQRHLNPVFSWVGSMKGRALPMSDGFRTARKGRATVAYMLTAPGHPAPAQAPPGQSGQSGYDVRSLVALDPPNGRWPRSRSAPINARGSDRRLTTDHRPSERLWACGERPRPARADICSHCHFIVAGRRYPVGP